MTCDNSPKPLKILANRGHRQAVDSLALSDDGKLLLSGGRDGRVILWNCEKGVALNQVRYPEPVAIVTLHPQGLFAAAVFLYSESTGRGFMYALRIWRTPMFELILERYQHPGESLAFSDDGQTLLAVSKGMVSLIPIPSPSAQNFGRRSTISCAKLQSLLETKIDTFAGRMNGKIAMSANGTRLAKLVREDLRGLFVYDMIERTGGEHCIMDNSLRAVAFLPQSDDQLLTSESKVRIHNLANKSTQQVDLDEHTIHPQWITSLAASPKTERMAIGDIFGHVICMDERVPRTIPSGSVEKPRLVAVPHRLNEFLYVTPGCAIVFDRRNLSVCSVIPATASRGNLTDASILDYSRVVLSYDNGYVEVADQNSLPRIAYDLGKVGPHWDGRRLTLLPGQEVVLVHGIFPSTGRPCSYGYRLLRVANASEVALSEPTIIEEDLPGGLWTAGAKAVVSSRRLHWLDPTQSTVDLQIDTDEFLGDEYLLLIEISPSRRLVAGGNRSGHVTLWDSQTGQIQRRLSAERDSVCSMLFLGDDERLAIATSYRNKVEIRNTDSGELLGYLDGHEAPVKSMLFDSGKILTASDDGTIRIWDASTYAELAFIDFVHLPKSGDEQTIWVAGTHDGYWHCPEGQERFVVCNNDGRRTLGMKEKLAYRSFEKVQAALV